MGWDRGVVCVCVDTAIAFSLWNHWPIDFLLWNHWLIDYSVWNHWPIDFTLWPSNQTGSLASREVHSRISELPPLVAVVVMSVFVFIIAQPWCWPGQWGCVCCSVDTVSAPVTPSLPLAPMTARWEFGTSCTAMRKRFWEVCTWDGCGIVDISISEV